MVEDAAGGRIPPRREETAGYLLSSLLRDGIQNVTNLNQDLTI
jgi:hypothetical protein